MSSTECCSLMAALEGWMRTRTGMTLMIVSIGYGSYTTDNPTTLSSVVFTTLFLGGIAVLYFPALRRMIRL